MTIAGLIFLLLVLLVLRFSERYDAQGDCPCCNGTGRGGCKMCEGSGWVPWCCNDSDEEDYGKCHFGTSSLGRDCLNCFRKR